MGAPQNRNDRKNLQGGLYPTDYASGLMMIMFDIHLPTLVSDKIIYATPSSQKPILFLPSIPQNSKQKSVCSSFRSFIVTP